MEIDHVVLAALSKADAEEVIDEAGLGIARGRVIPGFGLSNLIVPLRHGQLLEIHYPNGEAPAPHAPPLLRFDTEALAANPSAPLVPMAWLVVVEDEPRLRELAAMNEMSVIEAPAEGPGFPPYLLAGFGANFDRRWLPVLIHWPEANRFSTPSIAANPPALPVSTSRAQRRRSSAGVEGNPMACIPYQERQGHVESRSATPTGLTSSSASLTNICGNSRRLVRRSPSDRPR